MKVGDYPGQEYFHKHNLNVRKTEERWYGAVETKELLKWALQHIEFPLVPDPRDGNWWKGCPGCRIVWERDMQHAVSCPYIAAKDSINA